MTKQYSMDPESVNALVNYRLQRAKETLEEAQDMIEKGRYIAAVNRLYYACFYAVIAYLVREGITTKTHAGVKQQFGLTLVKTKKISLDLAAAYSEIFSARITGDYDDFTVFTEDMVLHMQSSAIRLVDEIDRIINQ